MSRVWGIEEGSGHMMACGVWSVDWWVDARFSVAFYLYNSAKCMYTTCCYTKCLQVHSVSSGTQCVFRYTACVQYLFKLLEARLLTRTPPLYTLEPVDLLVRCNTLTRRQGDVPRGAVALAKATLYAAVDQWGGCGGGLEELDMRLWVLCVGVVGG